MSNRIWKLLTLVNTVFLVFFLVNYLGFLPKPLLENIKDWTNFTINNPITELEKKFNDLEKSIQNTNLFWGVEYHNLVQKSEFDKYHHLGKSDVDWIVSELKKLRNNTTLSQEITYWKKQYDFTNRCNDYNYKSTEICREIRERIYNLQLKLNN